MGVPWHGRTNRIAAQSQPRLAQFPWVLNLIVRDGHVGKADFITIIDGWRTPQSEQQHGGDPRLCFAPLGGNARAIMIAQNPVRPAALRQCGLISRNERSKITRVPWRIDKLDMEGEMHARDRRRVVYGKRVSVR